MRGEKMDINSLVHSKDVADYCREIGYTFNSIEIAWLISKQYRLPIVDKNALYRELIDCYPDMKFHESVNFQGGSWLHEYLEELIKWNNGAIDFLHEVPKKSSNPYKYELCVYDRDRLELPPGQFASFEEALSYVNPYWGKIRSYNDINPHVRFVVTRIKETNKRLSDYLCADVNENGNILEVSAGAKLKLRGIYCPGNLYSMNIFFPVPFEPGDIVAGLDSIPVILKTLPQTELSGTSLRYYESVARTPHYATVYYVTADGHLADSFPMIGSLQSPFANGWGWNMTDLTYYKGVFDNAHKCLSSLSSYIKRVGIEQFMKEARLMARHKVRQITDSEKDSNFFQNVIQDLEDRRGEAYSIVTAYMKSNKSFDEIMAFLKS